MSPFDNRYLDLFDDQPDQKLERLVIDIDTISRPLRSVELSQRQDAAIREALRGSSRKHTQKYTFFPKSHSRLAVQYRFLIVASLVLCLFIAASTVFAGIPLVNKALQWQDTRSQQVSHHQLGQTIHLSQQACGFTMTLERVYADANDIVIGYTIQAPSARVFMGGFTPSSTTLTDTRGTLYQAIQGGGTSTIDNQTGNFLLFDTGGIKNLPPMLNLHLHIPSISTSERIENSSPSFSSCESYAPFKQDEVPQGTNANTLRKVTINGPLTFNVRIPFSSGQVIESNQVVTSDGTTVALKRVVITPLETRFYVSGITLAASADLSFQDHTIHASESRLLETGTIIYSFTDTVLTGQHGTWKLVVSSRHDIAHVTPGGAVQGGPWIFSINIP